MPEIVCVLRDLTLKVMGMCFLRRASRGSFVLRNADQPYFERELLKLVCCARIAMNRSCRHAMLRSDSRSLKPQSKVIHSLSSGTIYCSPWLAQQSSRNVAFGERVESGEHGRCARNAKLVVSYSKRVIDCAL